jgi:hypothetical protein
MYAGKDTAQRGGSEQRFVTKQRVQKDVLVFGSVGYMLLWLWAL